MTIAAASHAPTKNASSFFCILCLSCVVALFLAAQLTLNAAIEKNRETEVRIMVGKEHTMIINITDGGRSAAGYRGTTGDCVVRAIAIATEQPYQDVYNAINAIAEREKPRRGKRSNARTGVFKQTIRRYMQSLEWRWTPTMGIGTGCKVHLRAEELPAGRLIVSVSKHLVAVIDGVIHDNHDCSRGGTRCVYGYWSAPW